MSRSSSHSTAKFLRYILVSAAAGAAMAVSAASGAWIQSQYDERSAHRVDLNPALLESQRDAEYIRQNLAVLAAKVGDLQAKLIQLEGVGQRVAEAAGVAYTDPELHAGLEQALADANNEADSDIPPEWTAELLGRELDALERKLAAGAEQLRMLDTLVTQRTGMKEALPSSRPIDHPYLSSSYGWRRHPVTGRHSMHEGLDFAAPHGTPIYAASGGVVTEARHVPGYGKMVEINHGNEMVTRYAHASTLLVKPGDLVSKGQLIARVGATGRTTGAHLHFEVRIAGHPLDPKLFLEDVMPVELQLVSATNSADGP